MKSCREPGKLRRAFFRPAAMLITITLLSLTLRSSAPAAQGKADAKPAKPEQPSTTTIEATTAAVEIPRSEFKLPATSAEGKDPFFPRSQRIYASMPVPVPTVTTNRPPPVLDLLLSGLSGTTEKPFAIINNQTFAIGEERQMMLGGQAVRVVCLEINTQARTAVVQANGVRSELRLKQDN